MKCSSFSLSKIYAYTQLDPGEAFHCEGCYVKAVTAGKNQHEFEAHSCYNS